MSERIYRLPSGLGVRVNGRDTLLDIAFPKDPDAWIYLARTERDVLDLADVLSRVAEDIRAARSGR